MNIREALKHRALGAGFDLFGVAPVDAADDIGFAREWVEAGYGGEMRYLANPKRDDPRLILPSVRSVLCAGLVYNAPLPYSTDCVRTERATRNAGVGKDVPPEAANQNGPSQAAARGWISRYAWGRDYHDVMRARLEELRREIEALAPGIETRVFADTGPVIERAFARRSGIGWMGKNTCLINQQKGSWFFLGVILTNLTLEPDLPAPDRCGSCTRCIEACPTDALVKPYMMDATRCIAYLTIELKGSIPAGLRPAMGNNVFGCDICQDVCPWNSPQADNQPLAINRQRQSGRCVAATNQSEFQPLELAAHLPLESSPAAQVERQVKRQESNAKRDALDKALQVTSSDCGMQLPDSRASDASHPQPAGVSLFNPPLAALAAMTEDDFRRAFSHSPIKRAKYRGWLRNLCVAMGNSGDVSFIPWLESAAQHQDAIVRERAQRALERLTNAGANQR